MILFYVEREVPASPWSAFDECWFLGDGLGNALDAARAAMR
jgi:hypothetical protein